MSSAGYKPKFVIKITKKSNTVFCILNPFYKVPFFHLYILMYEKNTPSLISLAQGEERGSNKPLN